MAVMVGRPMQKTDLLQGSGFGEIQVNPRHQGNVEMNLSARVGFFGRPIAK
jgi:hypothetical protein